MKERMYQDMARQRLYNRRNVSVFRALEPAGGVNNIGPSEEWGEVTLYVDSGATDTVIGENMLKSIELKEGLAKRRGA